MWYARRQCRDLFYIYGKICDPSTRIFPFGYYIFFLSSFCFNCASSPFPSDWGEIDKEKKRGGSRIWCNEEMKNWSIWFVFKSEIPPSLALHPPSIGVLFSPVSASIRREKFFCCDRRRRRGRITSWEGSRNKKGKWHHVCLIWKANERDWDGGVGEEGKKKWRLERWRGI